MPSWQRAKRDYPCHECGKVIPRRSVYVRRQNRTKDRTEITHAACFIPKGPGGRPVRTL